ncbi:MAG: hypothetical protein Unbinned306contig1002_43 [Prokaryotic dsDNA virus sp.]|nr:MAG: hypothetical protein Unbinned306contig1002_43 [Prokaryotic dsDNA virus sp.]|tara:strand:- start:2752 stop:3201 length:450 start_codon:yes stop_codon:yes gene_type:complete
MIVFSTSAGQTLKIVPREYLGSFTVDVRDNILNKKFSYFINSVTTNGNFLEFDNTYVNNPSDLASIFKEARFYDLDIYADFNFWNTNLSLWQMYDELWQTDSNQKERIYKDRIFVTDQDIDQLNDNDHYNINKDVYKTNDSFNNEYIVI